MNSPVRSRGRLSPRLVRFALLWIAFLLGSSLLTAQSGITGSIRGVVSHATTGSQLEGAEVSIPSLGLRTLTDRDGTFVLNNVPAGSHSVRFRANDMVEATSVMEFIGEYRADLTP